MMRATNFYPNERGWMWEVWIDSRLVVVGWARTRERAELEAKLA
jgi:hypothetical protein